MGRMTATSVDDARNRLMEKIRELAYLYSEEPFTLASGRESNHFFDMKPVMMDPECAHLLGVLIHDTIEGIGGVDVVGPKGRGGRKTGNPPGIEGSSLQEGDRVILLEDVTTTGGSALKAARRLIEMGCELVACITILDREEGGAEAFEEAGIILLPLTVKSDIVG